ncbi:MAG: Holliday junction branch migration protein RuvA [Clostridia bacterium]|nr:Holliday junction branch migration protein RuvA [Clostridia bacterium]
MIGYVKGNLLSVNDSVVLLENSGIGYEITCSASALESLVKNNGGAVYTYMAVREDGVNLYGFISSEEKAMFLKLISVSGVGPKMGIGILSNMALTDLAVKIATSDIKGLSAIKGLGKKTAERIILELREKVVAGEEESSVSVAHTEEVKLDDSDKDALIALMSLGFTNKESEKAIAEAKQSGAKTIEELMTYAIKHIR